MFIQIAIDTWEKTVNGQSEWSHSSEKNESQPVGYPVVCKNEPHRGREGSRLIRED